MVKINSTLLPVKAHYFFFMAAMGPILPFLPVFGKQLGVSEVVMGLILSIIPILFLVAKPAFGFLLDYFQAVRKLLFICIVVFSTLFFALLQFIPRSDSFQQITCGSIDVCNNSSIVGPTDCQLIWHEQVVKLQTLKNNSYCATSVLLCPEGSMTDFRCDSFYSSFTFWSYVFLLSIASIGYNISNSVSDAICFDILGGGNESKYGQQRVWGTIGFGLSALLGGWCVDWWSGPGNDKDYAPAFLIAVIFTSVDLLCCKHLKLPELPQSTNIAKDVMQLVKKPSIATFLIFAAFMGICESLIIFFLFWYLEDLALVSGSMQHIKLLQGLVVAAETLVGEVVFFPLSGRILRTLGYQNCMTLCFLMYTLRLGLLSLVTDPWWALPVELLQGPSYALSYSTVVAYASALSPPGTSATMQGMAAGMDDGFGFSIGSIIGGLLYKAAGGAVTFQVFAGFSLFCAVTHWIINAVFFNEQKNLVQANVQRKDTTNIYNPPKEAAELVVDATS